MRRKIDLTDGNIIKKLLLVAIPVLATSFVQMAYNLTDIYWISKVGKIGLDGTQAVAALGTAGFYMWLAFGFILISKTGTEVEVSQNAGANRFDKVMIYASNGLKLTVFVGILYSLFGYFFRGSIVGIFNIEEANVVTYATQYLQIISAFMILYFVNPVLAGILNALGKSKIPFFISSTGLVLNIILDPIFILVFKMGVRGAAIATVISQLVVTMIFIGYYFISKSERNYINIFTKFRKEFIKKIVKISLPVSLHSILFTTISVIIGIYVAKYGDAAIATNRVGSQIESLAWLVASGFQVAMVAFVGQNLGAGKPDRIRNGYFKALKIMGIYGLLVNIVLYVFAKQLFGIFLQDSDVLPLGITYLKILSLSQVFMIVEIISQGAFNGLGKTKIPSFVGITFNTLRIPLAIILSLRLGLNGIWWAIVISSICKGTILLIWYLFVIRKDKINNFVIEYKKVNA